MCDTKSKTCEGYSQNESDDEPCDICKSCDRLRNGLGIEVKSC